MTGEREEGSARSQMSGRPSPSGEVTAGRNAEPSAAQDAAEFRRVIAASPADDAELSCLVSNVIYGRGALPKDVRRQIASALLSYRVILSVARDPGGVLGLRHTAEAEAS